jgi:RNA polymerase sigma-70 factor, ECF subfamily
VDDLCTIWPPQGERESLTTDLDAEFTALVQRQARFVFRVAYAVLLNAHDAEDAVQETFLKLYRNHGWRHAQNERAFLARAAWRVAVDLRPRASSPSVTHDLLEFVDTAPSLEPGPEQTLVSADQHALIHSMMNTLPEELRLSLVLSSFQELNSREIGSVLGIPEGTVRTRLHRARQILRDKLARLQVHPSEVRHA